MRSHLQRHHGALYAEFLELTGTHLAERVRTSSDIIVSDLLRNVGHVLKSIILYSG
jgi:transcriptional regulator of NAD metabolism